MGEKLTLVLTDANDEARQIFCEAAERDGRITVVGSTGNGEEALRWLKNKPFVGEDVYVFQAEDASGVLEWKSPQGQTAGEYIRGILENRKSLEETQKKTLGELYYEWYRGRTLPALPRVLCQSGYNLPESGQNKEETDQVLWITAAS